MDLEQPTKEHCAGIKANGDRCGAWPVGATKLCAGHSRLGIAADPASYAREGAAATALVRRKKRDERRMTLLDRIAAATEERAREIVGAYLSAGLGEKGDWRALDALITRVHGRPVEKVQQVDADPLDVASMSPEQRAVLMARVLEDHPGLAVLIPRTPDVQRAPQTGMDTEVAG